MIRFSNSRRVLYYRPMYLEKNIIEITLIVICGVSFMFILPVHFFTVDKLQRVLQGLTFSALGSRALGSRALGVSIAAIC